MSSTNVRGCLVLTPGDCTVAGLCAVNTLFYRQNLPKKVERTIINLAAELLDKTAEDIVKMVDNNKV